MESITTQSEEFIIIEEAQRTGSDNFMRWYEKPRGRKRPLWERLEDQAWKGEPCFLIGGGTSLDGFDFDRLRRARARVITCNKGYLSTPFADMMISIDQELHRWIVNRELGKTRPDQVEAFRKFREFAGLRVWVDMNNLTAGEEVSYVFRYPRPVIQNKLKKGIYAGNNTGVAALTMALTLRCDPIFLLGYDFYHAKGKSHFHDGYPRKQHVNTPKTFIPKFRRLIPEVNRLGIRVINLNPRSKLRIFPFAERDKIIEAYTKAQPKDRCSDEEEMERSGV